jgi:hypothetical protein
MTTPMTTIRKSIATLSKVSGYIPGIGKLVADQNPKKIRFFDGLQLSMRLMRHS